MDYDVIVRIPIKATDAENAEIVAGEVEEDIRYHLEPKSTLIKIECTGPSEET